jgi:HlyD family secretion protein
MEDTKQSSRIWLWLAAAVVVIIVFFVARSLTRDRLPIREARVSRQAIANQISTNGRAAPITNYEIHSPIAAVVKAVFVQQGDQVQAGKLLLQLDDIDARAHVAAAESGVRSAQAGLDAVTHQGSMQERQGAAADLARAQIDRDQAQAGLDSLPKLKAAGASASEVAAAQQRLDTANASLHAAQLSSQGHYAPTDLARAQSALAEAEANLAAAQEVEKETAPRAPAAGTVYSLNTNRSEFAEQGKLLMQIADLHHMRVLAYFDEPEIGQLAVGQKVQIKWDARPGQLWTGHVARVPSTVTEYVTRSVGPTPIDIDGGDGQLLTDANVTVTVTTSSETNVLTPAKRCMPKTARLMSTRLMATIWYAPRSPWAAPTWCLRLSSPVCRRATR